MKNVLIVDDEFGILDLALITAQELEDVHVTAIQVLSNGKTRSASSMTSIDLAMIWSDQDYILLDHDLKTTFNGDGVIDLWLENGFVMDKCEVIGTSSRGPSEWKYTLHDHMSKFDILDFLKALN